MTSEDSLGEWQDRITLVTARLEVVAREVRGAASRLLEQHPLDPTLYGPALNASLAASNAVGQAVTLKAAMMILFMRQMQQRTLAAIAGGGTGDTPLAPSADEQATVVRLERLAQRLEDAATVEARIEILLEPV